MDPYNNCTALKAIYAQWPYQKLFVNKSCKIPLKNYQGHIVHNKIMQLYQSHVCCLGSNKNNLHLKYVKYPSKH